MNKIFLFGPFFFGTAFSQVADNDIAIRQKELFKRNKVKFVSGWTFMYSGGKMEKKGQHTSLEKVDREGNRAEEVYYDSKGDSYYECTHYFDPAGNETTTIGFSPGSVIYNKWVYTPGSAYRSVEKRSTAKIAGREKWIFAYDERKNLTSEEHYDVDGNNTYRKTFAYNTSGYLVEKTEYDAFGSVYERTEYKYDASNLTDLVQYDSGNNIINRYEFKYDRNGNQVGRFSIDKSGEVKQLTVYLYYYYQ